MGTNVAKGSLSTFGFAVENILGTPTNANAKEFSFVNETIGQTTNAVISAEITPDRTVPEARGGNRASGGTVTMDFGINRHSIWLHHLLGGNAVKTTLVPAAITSGITYVRGDYVLGAANGNVYVCKGTGTPQGNPALNHTAGDAQLPDGSVWEFVGINGTPVYKYVLTAGAILPAGGLTVEKGTIGGDVNMWNVFAGGRVNMLTLTIPQDNMVQSAWDLMFLKSLPPTSSSDLSGAYLQNPTLLTDKSIMGYESLLVVSGSENYDMKEATLVISNNINANDYRLGSRDRKSVSEERRECRGTFTAYFTDASLYNHFYNEDVLDVLYTYVRNGNFLSIEYPESKFFGDPIPKTSGAGSITAAFDLTAYKNQAAYDCQVVIKSTNGNLF